MVMRGILGHILYVVIRFKLILIFSHEQFFFVSPRVPLVEVLMITNQRYLLLMANIELSDRLKLIKHQMKIIQAKDDNDEVD